MLTTKQISSPLLVRLASITLGDYRRSAFSVLRFSLSTSSTIENTHTARHGRCYVYHLPRMNKQVLRGPSQEPEQWHASFKLVLSWG